MELSRYIDLFLDESREHLRSARDLVASLRVDPADLEPVRRLFHHAHSLKGMSATMGLMEMVGLSHALEDLLDELRERAVRPDGALTATVAEALDCLERMLLRLERDGRAEDPGAAELGRKLEVAASEEQRTRRHGAARHPQAESPPAETRPPVAASSRYALELELDRATIAGARDLARLIAELARLGRVVRFTPPGTTAGDGPGRLRLVLECDEDRAELERRLTALDGVRGVVLKPAPPAIEPRRAPRSWVRVRADLLDSLLESSLELLVERARLERSLERSAVPGNALGRVELLLQRLHGDVMELRLVPFESVTRRLAGGVRDLAAQLGKRVRLHIEGSQVRIDRGVLDTLLDPLLHVLRNAVDHGIETPRERARRGKPETGVVRLRLARTADRVTIVVDDDGAGLSAEGIRRLAVERGVLTREAAATLDDQAALMLVTLPGFSTAGSAGRISGRGVGMDLVRDRVESLGGHLAVESRPGHGTAVRMSLPLTLSLVQALMVRCAGDLYALPVAMIERAIDLSAQATRQHDGRLVLRYGDEDVELHPVAERLGLSRDSAAPGASWALLVDAGGRRRALVVDEVLGRRNLVVRPLGAPLQTLREFSGAALLEDGSVTLVLDPLQLAP